MQRWLQKVLKLCDAPLRPCFLPCPLPRLIYVTFIRLKPAAQYISPLLRCEPGVSSALVTQSIQEGIEEKAKVMQALEARLIIIGRDEECRLWPDI